MLRFPFRLSSWLSVGSLCGVALLTGCASLPETMPGLERNVAFSPADFGNTDIHTRHVAASQSKTCEAARRALLSQGYLVNTATDELVKGRKYFQPTTDVHYDVEMRVVCATEGTKDDRTAAYASALQDRYVIKKINNSASLGVGALGSLSLPVSATDDTLVKVGSETVADPRFYEMFFQLFDRYVPVLAPGAPSPQAESQAKSIMQVPPDAGAVVETVKEKERAVVPPVTVPVATPIVTPVVTPVVTPEVLPVEVPAVIEMAPAITQEAPPAKPE